MKTNTKLINNITDNNQHLTPESELNIAIYINV